jgi:hypothetical protein
VTVAAAYLYGYTLPTPRLTIVELERRQTWLGLDPEFRRRLIAMFDASGGKVGIGGGWRSAAQQEALFRSRYTPFDSPPGTLWESQYWRKNPGVAPSTPPGRSYHEDSTLGGAIAADLIGDLDIAHRLGPTFGLRDLADVNNEPWHFQPIEVPTARRNHDGRPIPVWTIPGTVPPAKPPVRPITEDDDMVSLYQPDDGDPAVFKVDGIFAVSAFSDVVLADEARAGGVPATPDGSPFVHNVPRRVLKAYRLLGPLPDYSKFANVPRKTVSADFGSHEA